MRASCIQNESSFTRIWTLAAFTKRFLCPSLLSFFSISIAFYKLGINLRNLFRTKLKPHKTKLRKVKGEKKYCLKFPIKADQWSGKFFFLYQFLLSRLNTVRNVTPNKLRKLTWIGNFLFFTIINYAKTKGCKWHQCDDGRCLH